LKKNILITGCSSGIGLCCASALRNRGYRVFATARKKSDVKVLLQQGFESLQLDLNSSQSIETAVSEIVERTDQQLYALFNNGAYGQPGAVEDLSRQTLKANFETNVFGTHELTRYIIPVMRNQGFGRIIQNSSVLGFAAFKYRGAYVATKFALEGLTDTLRLELADTNIKLSLIEPGPISSRFRENAFAMYKKNIDKENSFHKAYYDAVEARLSKEGPATAFTLPPEAVLKRLIHALESRKPKVRYYVTVPTYLFANLKRLLPHKTLDKLLGRL